ncbi:hypothetical protein E2C01_060212 [Portunus trituberculatus]|uniref:Uncharacterized protein n=1 Tax=Portunus trituberculatus TaxID=210409 RepID=A0A5B7H894_PORTR|nr:hypothetical protein [Portunus trituberculatus]
MDLSHLCLPYRLTQGENSTIIEQARLEDQQLGGGRSMRCIPHLYPTNRVQRIQRQTAERSCLYCTVARRRCIATYS